MVHFAQIILGHETPPSIVGAGPDSQPWGITRFFNTASEYAHKHYWLPTSCPVNPESVDVFPVE